MTGQQWLLAVHDEMRHGVCLDEWHAMLIDVLRPPQDDGAARSVVVQRFQQGRHVRRTPYRAPLKVRNPPVFVRLDHVGDGHEWCGFCPIRVMSGRGSRREAHHVVSQ
jgi:hypothetical protein